VHATTLLDALGNARLQRNLNSSRYGKYLELGFDRAQALAGAHIRTYLLESVLVCSQSAEESNFHVFYQLVRGMYVLLWLYLLVHYFTVSSLSFPCSLCRLEGDGAREVGSERRLRGLHLSERGDRHGH